MLSGCELNKKVNELIVLNNKCPFSQSVFIGLHLNWDSFESEIVVHSVMSDSLWPRGLQHARLPCPPPSPGACSNSCPLSWWCHPAISSSAVPFFSCLQSFPASKSFPVSQFFTSGGQSIGASVSASVLQNEYSVLISIRIDWFGLLAVQGTSKESSLAPQFKREWRGHY